MSAASLSGRASGIDAGAPLGEIRINAARLDGCKVHAFPPMEGRRFGDRVVCQACNGWMSTARAFSYCKGFAAAGGDPGRVWPGFKIDR